MKIESAAKLEMRVRLIISEKEARALEAMACYGDRSFISAFYEKLGKSYMENHEEGLREFLKSCRDSIPTVLHQFDKAREAFETRRTPPKAPKTGAEASE